MNDFTVNIAPLQASQIVENEIVNGSFSAELVDRYHESLNNKELIVLVFEKYFMRTSSRASLTVTIQNIGGVTKVHAVGSGGGQGAFFGFDWGASDDFAGSVKTALSDYL